MGQFSFSFRWSAYLIPKLSAPSPQNQMDFPQLLLFILLVCLLTFHTSSFFLRNTEQETKLAVMFTMSSRTSVVSLVLIRHKYCRSQEFEHLLTTLIGAYVPSFTPVPFSVLEKTLLKD
jgi:hypothetical protein